MKPFILLILTIIAIGLVSCKDTQCPSFPTKLKEYYPYSNGTLLQFKNSNNDTLRMKVIKEWSSDSYSYEWNCKCVCGADAGFNTESDPKYSLKLMGVISYFDEDNFSILSCNFDDAQLSSDKFEVQKEIGNPYDGGSIELFGDTIFIEKRDYQRIGNVRIVRGKGITEFWDKKQNCNWVKID